MQTPVSVHALAQLPKPRYRGAVALLRAVRGSRRRGGAGGDRAGRARHVRCRGLRHDPGRDVRRQRALPPGQLVTAHGPPAAAARPHRDLPAHRGHVHADRAAGDGRHRAGDHPVGGLAGRGGRDRVRVDADPGPAGLRHHACTCSSGGSARSRSSRCTRPPGGRASAWSRGGGLATPSARSCTRRRRPDPWPETFGYHEIFHVFVILAALLHYFAIAFLVLPLGA